MEPVFGVCLGWPAEQPGIRPRLRADLLGHTDRYSPDQARQSASVDAASLVKGADPITAEDLAAWRREVVRGLRRARQRSAPPPAPG